MTGTDSLTGQIEWKVFLIPVPGGDYHKLTDLFAQTDYQLSVLEGGWRIIPELDDGLILLDCRDQEWANGVSLAYQRLMPLIALTTRQQAERVMEAGAWDYLLVDELNKDVLLRSLRYVTFQRWILAQLDARTHDLHVSEARFHNLVARNGDGILVVDHQGNIQFTNPAAEHLFQRGADDLVGTPFGFPVGVDETSEITVLQPSGRMATVEMRVVETEWDGQTARLVTLRDMTERNAAQQALIEQERLRVALEKERELSDVKSMFMHTVSHEFRTPLAMIMTASELLLHYADRMTDDQRQLRLATIQAQIKHMEAMMQEIALVIRADQGRLEYFPERVDFRELASSIVDELRSTIGAQHRITFHAQPGSYQTMSDRKLMRHIIHNIFTNAAKYSKVGSAIHVSLKRRVGEYELSVRDEGIGIPAEDLGRLFQPFYRARNVGTVSGTGLGLKVVKDCVDAHGGRISVESALGVGTLVTVSIPVVLG
ncbi:MAG: PAS domain S-box protein [Anaerolineae bacterium]|nr:PAS domain S-box protein [Anaerolineae bacterium]